MENASERYQKLIRFRRLEQIIIQDYETPVHSRYRNYTDSWGLFIGGIGLSLWLYFLLHFSSQESDLRRIFFPVDNCGNFCGIDNEKIPDVECSGLDFSSNGSYLLSNECVSSCPYNISVGTHTCIERNSSAPFNEFREENKPFNESKTDSYRKINTSTNNIFRDLFQHISWWSVIILLIVTLVMSGYAIYQNNKLLSVDPRLFHFVLFFPHLVVLMASITFVVKLFPWWKFLEIAIVLIVAITLVTIFNALYVIYGNLFQTIYKQATIVAAKMPWIVFFLLLVNALHFLVLIFSIFALMQALTSSDLIEVSKNYYKYEEVSVQEKILIALFLLTTNWTLHILAGIHCMVIGAAVTSWYFKGESEVSSYVFKSLCWTVRYHLGTITYWALYQPWTDVIKFSTNCLAALCPFHTIHKLLDQVTMGCEYFSKLSLIETAIHGQPLLRSAKRAVEMIKGGEGILTAKTLVNLLWLEFQFIIIKILSFIAFICFAVYDESSIWISLTIMVTVIASIVSTFIETEKIVANALLICYFEYQTINGTKNSDPNLDCLEKFIDQAKEKHRKLLTARE